MAGAKKHNAVHGVSLLSEYDVHLFREGRHCRLYDKLGAHALEAEGQKGVLFAVWAPNAEKVTVLGGFNGWDPKSCPLAPRWDGSGIWEGFVPGIGPGELYKYRITSRNRGYAVNKSDPFAFLTETPPRTASVVSGLEYGWEDEKWMTARKARNNLTAPISIYEVHLGSWRRQEGKAGEFLSYADAAHKLAAYARETGFTHVELLPVMEHPFYGSWGYQTTGYFAPSARYGSPQGLMGLVDELHRAGLGVILDWVPSHFPMDEHGLAFFDGTHLFEHADPRQGYHPDWHSAIFNYGRREVRSFLLSSALFWLDHYHADGLRVDAVASMLYLDYSRREGEWIPNAYGGRENLEALEFLRSLNEAVSRDFPDALTVAEESTAWPMVSRPVHVGGLGFSMKWNMGWMHDTLEYAAKDPLYRRHHQDKLTFSLWYAFSENFVLPLSHDEVVHGKGSLLGKMPGDEWRKFANLRLLYGYMWAHPGKKLLFMGGEFGQWREWSHEHSLDWDLLEHPPHQELRHWVGDLNRLYREEPALHELDCRPEGFRWVDFRDAASSVVSFLRLGFSEKDMVLAVFNFTPVPRSNYRIGVPKSGFWEERLNSDSPLYGGSGWGNMGGAHTSPIPSHGYYASLSLNLPPLGVLFLRPKAQH